MPAVLAMSKSGGSKENIISRMKTDLAAISAAIKARSFSGIKFPAIGKLVEMLTNILVISSDSGEAQRLLRLSVFLFERHLDKIYPEAPIGVRHAVIQKIQDNISAKIGVVPSFNSEVKLPEEKFLPKKFYTKTMQHWQTIACENPGRGKKNVAEGIVDFVSLDGKASVRRALESEAAAEGLSHVDSGSDRFYLNLINYGYYELGLLHADHLLPSASLIKRIKEIIEAMNYDVTFQTEMESKHAGNGYFLRSKTESEKTVGTYWLYMMYHNSMQNLWFLLASDNSGEGKVAADPMAWFKTHDIGRAYLENLAEGGKHVDQRTVIYTVSGGAALKDSFIAWAKANRREVVKVCRQLSGLHHDMRADAIAAAGSMAGAGAASGPRLRSTLERELAARSFKVGFFGKPQRAAHPTSDDDSSELSSVASEDRSRVRVEVQKITASDKELIETEKKVRSLQRKVIRTAKKRVAKDDDVLDNTPDDLDVSSLAGGASDAPPRKKR